MKKNNYSPYSTFSLEKVVAPKPNKATEPKSSKNSSDSDLRGGKKNGRA